MPKQIEEIPLVAFKINYLTNVPLYKQLYNAIIKSIREGKFSIGQKLPGTRSLVVTSKTYCRLRIFGILSKNRNSTANPTNILLVQSFFFETILVFTAIDIFLFSNYNFY